MRLLLTLLLSATLLASCNSAKQKARDTIHGAGETVGKGSSEFFKGISEGVDESFGYSVSLSDRLKEKGLEIGKCRVGEEDSLQNILTAYLIFDQDFQENILVKVFDHNKLEYGRSRVEITAKKGEARYVDFTFDARTNLETKSTFVFE